MSVTLAPTPPVRFTINRLKASFADPTLFSDQDLLGFINDGYVNLVEQTRYLRAYATVTLVDGQREYPLPSQCCEILRLYIAGERQTPIALDEAASGIPGPYYYQVDQVYGLVTAPTSGSALIYYAKRPTLLGMDSTPVIPPEYYYLLRHYAAWRCILLQRGAEGVLKPFGGLPRAQGQRAIYDRGIHALRAEMLIEVAPRRLSATARMSVAG